MSNILLIEPDKILAGNIARVLKKNGHAVNQQVDPQIALDSADTILPDVIVLDLILAGRSGIEFLYEFRSYPDWLKIPIVLFSSLSARELRESLPGFDHLNITAYHHKSNTSLSQLAKSVDRILQPVTK